MSTSSLQGGGMVIITDPDQEKNGYYKVCRTANIQATLTSLNAARACKDIKVLKFFPCSDLKKLGDFVESALKNKFMPGSKEWVKVDSVAAIEKISNTVEALADITNGD